MKLLFITQIVDENDPGLGFVTRWIEELASRSSFIEVICLKGGSHKLPQNVRIHSLGKENMKGKGNIVGKKFLRQLRYTACFYAYVWKLRKNYDAVFVHMNQEYILLAGPLWKVFGKKIYLWRNHYAGNWYTDIAAAFCTKVFCTSKHSYTIKYKKTILMPVGVDTKSFLKSDAVHQTPNSILFLARMAPSKRPEMLIDALYELKQKNMPFTATFVGSPLPEYEAYYTSLSKRALGYGLTENITFLPGVTKKDAVDIFRSHKIFVNCSPSGMLDKTMFEAAACGAIVLSSSEDFKDTAGKEAYAPNTQTLSERLIDALQQNEDAVLQRRTHLQAIAQRESLGTLMDRIQIELK